jgi:hypothetical protein
VREKTKIVSINGMDYELRRFPANVGSFIVMQILGAGISRQSDEATQAPPQNQPRQKGEDIARAVTTAALMQATEEFHNLLVGKCIRYCGRMEGTGAIPICTSGGTLLPDLADDLTFILKLVVEMCAFNFADFFDQGGMRPAAAQPDPNSIR